MAVWPCRFFAEKTSAGLKKILNQQILIASRVCKWKPAMSCAEMKAGIAQ